MDQVTTSRNSAEVMEKVYPPLHEIVMEIAKCAFLPQTVWERKRSMYRYALAQDEIEEAPAPSENHGDEDSEEKLTHREGVQK